MAAPATDETATATNGGPEPREGTGPPQRLALNDANAALAKLVATRWKQGSDELQKSRRHFWQNMSFFFGEQWVWWDPARSALQALPQGWSPIGPGRARLTINRIEPNVMSVLARLMASNLQFDVAPNDSSDDLINAARLAEKVLAAEHDTQDWENVRYDALFASIMGGTSAIAVEWDPAAGQTLEIGTDGRVVGTGGVRLQALNCTEFVLEPGVRDHRDARWWVMGLAMSPRQARERYGLNWLPKADAGSLMSPLQHKILADVGRPSGTNLALVMCLYERPNNEQPKGRYVCVINDTVVSQAPWPFPFQERLNVRITRQRQVTGQWLGWTYMNAAIPVQFAYNHARSVIAEHMKIAGNARLVAPYGAFAEEDFTNDPASILWFSPDVSGAMPAYLNPPNLPRWLSQEAQDLSGELDDIMHVHATSRGEASFDRASGQALALLSEKDDSPLGPMAREQSQAWSEIAEMVLKLHQAKATEPRRATIRGDGGQPVQVTWTGRALKNQTNAKVPLDVTQPRSKAAMQAFATSLWQMQIITDPQAFARIAGIEPEALIDVLDADVARAQRENARMLDGQIEMVEDFDDHAKHIAEHNRARKQDAYLYASPEIRWILDQHVQMHETQAGAEYGSQVARASVDPGLAKLPQGAEPVGSQVPPDFAESQAMDPQMLAALQAQPGADPGQSPVASPFPTAPPGAPSAQPGPPSQSIPY